MLAWIMVLTLSTTGAFSTPVLVDYSTTTLSAYTKAEYVPGLWETLNCESGFQWDAEGDNHTSLGVSQLHMPAHPEITKEQALNPFWAIDYAAQQFRLGHQKMWSCFSQHAS